MDRTREIFSLSERAVLLTLNVVGWFWSAVTFVPWFYLSGNNKKYKHGRIQARRVQNSPDSPYRSVKHMNNMISDFRGTETLSEMFKNAADRFPNRRCLGTRELLSEEDEIQPNGRAFKKVILGEYDWLTFSEVADQVKKIGSGFQALGQKPKKNIAIFAETRAEWIICAEACFAHNFPVVTIYATLGEEALVYGINQADVELIVTDAHLIPKLKTIMDQLHFINTIVYLGDAKKVDFGGFPSDLHIYSMNEVKEIGSRPKNLLVKPEPPLPDDTAVIMYTSGSTGMPKGVVISHKNLVCSLAANVSRIPNVTEKDVYIGYLPLAHVLELCAECGVLAHGACIGYSSALTLSDQSSKIKKGSKGDVSVLKPTLMAAVPMIMDRIRKSVIDKVKEGPRFLQLLFHFAYNYKLCHIKRGYDTPLLNRLFFSKISAILGGKVRAVLSGGAPLSADTEDFMNVCFSCPVGQGYGLTETCGGGTVCEVWDYSTGRVGSPIGCAEIKLTSWEEGGYTTYDKPHPRGEIAISGFNVTKGYYKQPEKTQEVYIEEDGKVWFYTGDIGEVHKDGCLKIIDRKKDLVKLSAGEYISLSKVEAALKQSPYIDNCCLYCDSAQFYAIVFIVPNPKSLKDVGIQLAIKAEKFEDVCNDPKIIKEMLNEVVRVSKKGKLEKFEIPKKIKLCTEQWLPESELVTAAFKLKRKNLQKFYQKDIDLMYRD